MSRPNNHPTPLLQWLKDLNAVAPEATAKELPELKRLDLSSCKLERLHEEIGTLKGLAYLNLAHNAIRELPESFTQLTALISLNLRRNRLSRLPEGIGGFCLSSINLSGNRIEEISMLSRCRTLRTIDVSGNFLHTINGVFDQAPNLRTINAEANLIREFTVAPGSLKELESLNLSSNRLKKLPEGIERLDSLAQLNLADNIIEDDLSRLRALELETLDMSSNALRDLRLKGMSELQSCVVDNNPLETIEIGDDFAPQLKSFSAQGCGLKSFLLLPSDRLNYLCYSSNEIESLPESIVTAPHLHELDIDDNALTGLPESFSGLKELQSLYIEGNPLENAARELIAAMGIPYCDIFVKKDIIVRKAQFDDLKEMAQLLAQLFAIETDFVYDYEKHYRGLMMMYNEPKADLVVAKYRNRVIGMVTLQELISSAEGGVAGQLEDLIVDSAFRKMGVGTRLVRTIFDLARERSLLRIQLAADKANPNALRFYRQRGFTLTNLTIYRYVGIEA